MQTDLKPNTLANKSTLIVLFEKSFYPVADIDNADLAYAWMRYDSTLNKDGSFSDTADGYGSSVFQLQLQQDTAYAFAEHINSLNLVDEDYILLSLDLNAGGKINLRSGSYYETALSYEADPAGFDAGHALVWDMGQGSNGGTTTGAFTDWVEDICED